MSPPRRTPRSSRPTYSPSTSGNSGPDRSRFELTHSGDTPARLEKFHNRDERALYREERDDRSVLFQHHIPAGRWEIRTLLRSAFATDFRALPVTSETMYVPAIAAHSEARRPTITELP